MRWSPMRRDLVAWLSERHTAIRLGFETKRGKLGAWLECRSAVTPRIHSVLASSMLLRSFLTKNAALSSRTLGARPDAM